MVISMPRPNRGRGPCAPDGGGERTGVRKLGLNAQTGGYDVIHHVLDSHHGLVSDERLRGPL